MDAATVACHDRLVDDGVALDSYNTAENAADIADLRVAMGIEEWDLYGVSYGTALALTVLRDHPEGVRSVVLDSVSAAQHPLDCRLLADGRDRVRPDVRSLRCAGGLRSRVSRSRSRIRRDRRIDSTPNR